MTAERITQRRSAGPFFQSRLLYRLGFDVQEEMELEDGYRDVGTAHLPEWALKAAGPYGGIVGEWTVTRHRQRFLCLPIWRWRPGPATHKQPRRRQP